MRLSKLIIERHDRAKRLAVLHESTAPLLGPYYWIPTPHGWDLLSYPEAEFGEIMHDRAWRRYVIPYLQDLWPITDAEARELSKCPYGLPRGRISHGDAYYLNHGNDAPLPAAEAIGMVIREMNLTGLHAAGKLRVVLDNHEVQVKQHKRTVGIILATAKGRTQKAPDRPGPPS